VDRLFLDANVLFSAAYLQVNALQGLWTLANVELISSDVARREAETNLAKKRPARLPNLAVLLQSVAAVPDAPAGAVLPSGMQLPAKDEPIFLACQHAGASHFLTGDAKHFGPYFDQSIGGVLIERPGTYLHRRLSSP